MKRILGFVFSAVLLFAACQKEPSLTLSGPTSLEWGGDGGSQTITFTSNYDWAVSSSDSWVSVSPASGKATDDPVTVTVKCSANSTYDERKATITIDAQGLTQSVAVRQAAAAGMILPTKSFELSSDARTIQVEVQTNVEYTVTVSEPWIKQSGTKALDSSTLTFSVEENTSYDARNATITIKPEGAVLPEQVVSVTQAQKNALLVGDTQFEMPYGGGEIEVKVEANVDFEVKSGADWIQYVGTKALNSSTVRLKVAENQTYSNREGQVEIMQKDGPLAYAITVKQAGRVAVTDITLSSTTLSLMEGDTAILTATVSPYNATDKNVSWSSDNKAVATVDNGGNVTAVGAGTAKITAKAGDKSAVCTVTVEKVILAVGDVVEIPAEGGTFEVDIEYNTNFFVQIEESALSWITFIQTKATVHGKMQFYFAENSNSEPRSGKVTIKDLTGRVDPVTITFTQACVPFDYEAERAALVALYNATGGDHWDHNDNWCSDKPLDEWFGIYTDNQHVTIVALSLNNLTGQIPPEIFNLPKLMSLMLDYNSITGTIPEEVANAKTLTMLHLQRNELTGTIPESLYGMNDLTDLQVWSNHLTGELSEKFWDMPSLETLILDDNKFTGQLTPAVRKAERLHWLGLGSNNFTGTIPTEITDLKDLYYFSIENHPISNGAVTEAANTFTGTIPDNLDKLQNLEYFLVENNNLEGTLPTCLARMPKLIGLELYGNRLSGEIPEEVANCDNWDIWAPDANIMPQQDGYTLSFAHYESTDFSEDGKVTKLQSHAEGNGINIVITGDCFTDQDIARGDFAEIARQTMEDFFAIEPFTTFRNLFDVYAVTAVSKTRYSNYGTALGAWFGEGSTVACDEEKVKEYSSKAVGNLDETLTIVIVNKNRNSGTAYLPEPDFDTDYGSGFSFACFGLMQQGEDRRLLINHEANGHGFTKLHDEYVYRGTGDFPEGDKQYLRDASFSKGFFANIDFEADPTKVKWARFLADERYQYDGLGVFEGGMTYEFGVYRPSDFSIMRSQSPVGDGSRFNAPSRAAAYIRIHKLAYGSNWQFDYEEFVKYDAVNRRTTPLSAPPAILRESETHHTPPVILKSRRGR